MRVLVLVLVLVCLFACSSVVADGCPVEIEVKRSSKGDLELSLENRSSEVLDFACHDLPWVVQGQGGAGFKIYIDGKQIPVARGMGNNNEPFRIWPQSKVSGVVDAYYLKTYYRDIDKSRVRIEWSYYFPGRGKYSDCRLFSGELPTL